MREKIVDALSYPRQLVRDGLDFEVCRHNGQFDSTDPDCLLCDDGPECRWLYDTDEFAALTQRPLNQLVGALEFAILSVTTHNMRWKHKSELCNCEGCNWLREAQELYDTLHKGGYSKSKTKANALEDWL
ncbi:MAG: hypothetical protein JSW10_01075 [Pseudomonadota bacterium]|nr:MAG: hypothetical protein JSW10_01075 [Pseudomonadota bacterium]